MNCFLCVQELNGDSHKNNDVSIEESAYLCSFLQIPSTFDEEYRKSFRDCTLCDNCKYKVIESKNLMQKLEKLELEIRVLRDEFYDSLKQGYFQKLTSNTSSHDDFSDNFRAKIVQALHLVINVAPETTIVIDDEEFSYQIVEVCGSSSINDDDDGFQLSHDEQITDENINSKGCSSNEEYQNQDDLLKLQPLTSTSTSSYHTNEQQQILKTETKINTQQTNTTTSTIPSTSFSTSPYHTNEQQQILKTETKINTQQTNTTTSTIPSTSFSFSTPKTEGDSYLQKTNFDVEIHKENHGIVKDVSIILERLSTESIIRNCDQRGKKSNRSKLCKKSKTRIKGRLHCLFPNCIVTFRNEAIRRAHIRKFHTDQNKKIRSLQKKRKSVKQASNSAVSNSSDDDSESNPAETSKPFSCTFRECSANFLSKLRLESHLRRVHGQTSVSALVCNICNKSNFASRRQFNHHLIYHQPKKYNCNVCNKGFVRAPDMRRHEKTHAPRKRRNSHPINSETGTEISPESKVLRPKLICPHEGCELVYYEKFRLEVHHRKVHLGMQNPYKCRFPDCQAEMKNRPLYDKHMKNCHSIKPKVWTCKICPDNIEFHARKLYDEHMEVNHPEAERKGNWSCLHCDEKFRTLDLRASHIKSNHPDKKTPLTKGKQQNEDSEMQEIHVCHVCGIKKVGKSKLKEHLKYHGKKHGCPLCPDKMFSRLADLRRHSLTHSEERNAICDRCGKSFKDPGYLRVHHRTCLVVERQKFPCTVEGCTSIYSNESSLKTHLKEHDGSLQRTHKCDLCDFKAKWSSTIMYHRRSHFLTKDFACHICPAKFKQKNSLNLHIDFKHLGKRGKNCTFAGCSYKAADKQALTDHMRTHTKEKPFVCKTCSRPFSKKCHLLRHERTQHNFEKELKKPGRPRKEFVSRICIEEQRDASEQEQKVAEYLVYDYR